MADYKINEFGEFVFKNGREQHQDPLWEEYAKLEYEVLNNHHNPTKDHVKIARYNELKKQLCVEKSVMAFNKAKEQIKQKIISANKENDKDKIVAAITQFEKTND